MANQNHFIGKIISYFALRLNLRQPLLHFSNVQIKPINDLYPIFAGVAIVFSFQVAYIIFQYGVK